MWRFMNLNYTRSSRSDFFFFFFTSASLVFSCVALNGDIIFPLISNGL